MKKTFLLITLFCSTLFLRAQENKSYWGFKAGLNISEIDNKDQNEFNLATSTGLYAEVFRNFRLNDLFALQTGAIFSQN